MEEKEKIQILNETYVSLIKISLSTLGPIGIALDEFIFNFGDRLKSKRFNEFINEINSKLKIIEVKQNEIDKIYNNESLYNIIIEVFKLSLKVSSDEKRNLLANFFINKVILNDKIEEDYNSLLIKYIDELTVTHLSILIHIQTKIEEYKSLKKYEDLYQDYCNANSINIIEKSYFRALVKDLENKTLCVFSKNVLEYGSTGGILQAETSDTLHALQITDLGNEIINLLKNDVVANS